MQSLTELALDIGELERLVMLNEQRWTERDICFNCGGKVSHSPAGHSLYHLRYFCTDEERRLLKRKLSEYYHRIEARKFARRQ